MITDLPEQIETDVLDLLKKIDQLGFKLCLVGGFVRDFLISKKIGYDLDFEIRSSDVIQDVDWPNKYQKLLDFFYKNNIQVEKLPYLITRVKMGLFSLEFSSPRMEIFERDNHSHHNFNALLSSSFSYVESFKRRDFTINSIGVELNFNLKEWKIVDPYDGVEDLKNKKIRNVSDDFYLDPVRFLRCIRFQHLFSFSLTENLEKNLDQFNLTELSDYYFLSECFKYRPILFVKKFIELVKDNKIKIQNRMKFIMDLNLNEITNIDQDSMTKEDFLLTIFLTNLNVVNETHHLLGLPQKTLKDFKLVFDAIKIVENLSIDHLKTLVSFWPSDFSKQKEVVAIKTLVDKEEIYTKLVNSKNFKMNKLDIPIQLFKSVEVEQVELNSLDNNLRSYFKIYKALKKWSADE